MNKFLYLGENGFPHRFAAVQRQKLIARALLSIGAEVLVLCRKGIHNRNDYDIDSKGSYEGVKYKYCSGTAYYPSGFALRTILKILGFVVECMQVIYAGRVKKFNYAIVSTFSYSDFKLYRTLCKLAGVKIILDCVESYTDMDGREAFKTNDINFENNAYRKSDGILYISEYLKEKIQKLGGQNMLKVPIINDFDKFERFNIEGNKDERYVLFCGSALYRETIEFVISSFDSNNEIDTSLYILTNGKECDINGVKKFAASANKKDKITILDPVSEERLIELYKCARALLIPIRPVKQDIARFPHKIGEYISARRPIVTTNIGEVPYYFTDLETAFIANNYDHIEFGNKMAEAVKSEEKVKEVTDSAFELGLKFFDYKAIGAHLEKYINTFN